MTITTETPIDSPTHTPWGSPQSKATIAAGIVLYTTNRHGGYWLAKHREQARRNRFPEFATSSGGPWYEQDTDAHIVALTFPELFEVDQLAAAVRTLRAYAKRPIYRLPSPGWRCAVNWIDGGTKDANEVIRRVMERERECQHLWERASYWPASQAEYPRGTWGATFRKPSTGETKTVYIRYPDKRFYSDAELQIMAVRRFGIVA